MPKLRTIKKGGMNFDQMIISQYSPISARGGSKYRRTRTRSRKSKRNTKTRTRRNRKT